MTKTRHFCVFLAVFVLKKCTKRGNPATKIMELCNGRFQGPVEGGSGGLGAEPGPSWCLFGPHPPIPEVEELFAGALKHPHFVLGPTF